MASGDYVPVPLGATGTVVWVGTLGGPCLDFFLGLFSVDSGPRGTEVGSDARMELSGAVPGIPFPVPGVDGDVTVGCVCRVYLNTL